MRLSERLITYVKPTVAESDNRSISGENPELTGSPEWKKKIEQNTRTMIEVFDFSPDEARKAAEHGVLLDDYLKHQRGDDD